MFLFFFAFFALTTCANHVEFKPYTTSTYYWRDLLNSSNDIFADLFLPSYLAFENVLGFDNSTSSDPILSDQCQRSLQEALKALGHQKSWAVELFNSWAQAFPPTGAVSGTFTDLGDFDQCLAVDPTTISTQYCLLQYRLPMPRPRPKHHNFHHPTPHLLPSQINGADYRLEKGSFYRKLEQVSSLFYYTNLQIAICLPRTCLPEDVQMIASKGLNFLNTLENFKY